jgi:hypothetical protein
VPLPSDRDIESALMIARHELTTQFDSDERQLLRVAQQLPRQRRRARSKLVAGGVVALLFAGTSTAAALRPNAFRFGGIDLSVSPPVTTKTTAAIPAPNQSTNAPGQPPVKQVTIPSDATTWPGEPVTIEEASERFGRSLALPTTLKAPRSLFWLTPPTSGQVTAVWSPSASLPPTNDPKVGLLLTQFFGVGSGAGPIARKTARANTTFEMVKVRQQSSTGKAITPVDGWWISGTEHVVEIVDEDGSRIEQARVAGNTLIWVVGDVTFRLEANLTKTRALALAATVREPQRVKRGK